tara:strand:+ start:11925 stop:12182 length:258 start_codon:yes stop_codon:yes gene_type:complete
MNINTTKLAIATGLTFSLLWILCIVVVMLFPQQLMHLSGAMMHMDSSQWQWAMNIEGAVIGLLAWGFIGGATAWLIATTYNRLIS